MNKLLVAGGVAVGAALLARRYAPGPGRFDVGKMLERMPERERGASESESTRTAP